MTTIVLRTCELKRAWYAAEERYERELVKAYGMDAAGIAWHDERGIATPELCKAREAWLAAARKYHAAK